MSTNPTIPTDSSTPMDSTVTEAVARLEKVAEWYETGPRFPKEFEEGRQRIAADIRLLLAVRSASLPSGLDDLPVNFQLSWGEVDDPSECVWQVHSVNGGRNDREWTLVATGDTPSEAIREALSKGEVMQAVSRPKDPA